MNNRPRPIQQLWGELHDLEARYDLAKEAFSAEDALSGRRCGASQRRLLSIIGG
jgi:hypothetical protein